MSAEAIKQAHGSVSYFVFSGRTKLDVGKLVWTSAISNSWLAVFKQNTDGRICRAPMHDDALDRQ